MLKDLYAELGRLLVQAEILGTVTIPNQGQLGAIKKQISEQLNAPKKDEAPKEPVTPVEPEKK